MGLLAYNTGSGPVTLNGGRHSPTVQPCTTSSFVYYNVTEIYRDNTTVDWTNLENQRVSSSVGYVWDGVVNYDTTPLQVSFGIPVSISGNFHVGAQSSGGSTTGTLNADLTASLPLSLDSGIQSVNLAGSHTIFISSASIPNTLLTYPFFSASAGTGVSVSPVVVGLGDTFNVQLQTQGTAGTYNSLTVDAFGRISSGTVQPYLTGAFVSSSFQFLAGNGLQGTGLLTGTVLPVSLTPSGTAGTYNTITVDAFGRATSGSNANYLLSGNYVLDTRQILTVGGLQGGGDLTVDRTLSLTNSGSAGIYTTVQVDTKGRISSGSSVPFASASLVLSAGNGIISIGDLSANRTIGLTASGTAGTYNTITVDAFGRATGGSNVGYYTYYPSLSASYSSTTNVSGNILLINSTDGPVVLQTVGPNIGTIFQIKSGSTNLFNTTDAGLVQLGLVGGLTQLSGNVVFSASPLPSASGTLSFGSVAFPWQNIISITGSYQIIDAPNSNTPLGIGTSNANFISFGVGGSTRWQIDANGAFRPASSGTYDIGLTSLPVRNIIGITGSIQLLDTPNTNQTLRIGSNNAAALSFTHASSTNTVTPFSFTVSSNTGQTANTEVKGVDWILNVQRQWNAGNISTQREFSLTAPIYAFTAGASGSIITNAATLAVTAPPSAGSNATITNAYALWILSGKSLFGGTVQASTLLVSASNGLDTAVAGQLLIGNGLANAITIGSTGNTTTFPGTVQFNGHVNISALTGSVYEVDNLSTTQAAGVTVENLTVGTVGVPHQNSPGFELIGQAYAPVPAVSQTSKWLIQNLPQPGWLGNVTSQLNFFSSENGAAYTCRAWIDTSGSMMIQSSGAFDTFLSGGLVNIGTQNAKQINVGTVDGTGSQPAMVLVASYSGSGGVNSITFNTNNTGLGFVMDSANQFRPLTDLGSDLGNSSKRFGSLYFSDGHGSSFDTVSATALQIGQANATNVTIGNSTTVTVALSGTNIMLSGSNVYMQTSGGFDLVAAGTMHIAPANATNISVGGSSLVSASFGAKQFTMTAGSTANGAGGGLSYTAGSNSGITSATEWIDILFNLNRTITHVSGNYSLQRAFVIEPPTYAFTGATTLAQAATLAITGPPGVGSNGIIANQIPVLINNNSIITSLGKQGISLQNTTVATAGVAEQDSPGLEFVGTGWTGSASATMRLIQRLLPKATTSQMNWDADFGGGSYSNVAQWVFNGTTQLKLLDPTSVTWISIDSANGSSLNYNSSQILATNTETRLSVSTGDQFSLGTGNSASFDANVRIHGKSTGNALVVSGSSANTTGSLALFKDSNGHARFGIDTQGMPTLGSYHYKTQDFGGISTSYTTSGLVGNTGFYVVVSGGGLGVKYLANTSDTTTVIGNGAYCDPSSTAGGAVFFGDNSNILLQQNTSTVAVWEWSAMFPSQTSNVQSYMGLIASNQFAHPNGFGFWWPGSGNWEWFTDNGTTRTITALSVAVAPTANTFQRFRIEFYGSATPVGTAAGSVKVAKLYIDGTLVQTITGTNVQLNSGGQTFGIGNNCLTTAAAPYLTLASWSTWYSVVTTPFAP